MNNLDKLIVVEGPDFSGKTTVASFISEILQEVHQLSYEPSIYNYTSNSIVDVVKKGLFNIFWPLWYSLFTRWNIHPDALTYLEYGNRHLFWTTIATKILDRGEWLIMDRFIHSEYVYGKVRNTNIDWINSNVKFTFGDALPLATIILLPTEGFFHTSRIDAASRGHVNFHYDCEEWNFHQQIIENYKQLPEYIDRPHSRKYVLVDDYITKDEVKKWLQELRVI